MEGSAFAAGLATGCRDIVEVRRVSRRTRQRGGVVGSKEHNIDDQRASLWYSACFYISNGTLTGVEARNNISTGFRW